MSTDNMDDGEDHSRIIAVHEWLHSALYAESAYPSSKWWVHSLCLGKLLDIPGGALRKEVTSSRLSKREYSVGLSMVETQSTLLMVIIWNSLIAPTLFG